MLDVLFRGARVYDGASAKSVTAPVGVREGTIVNVGDTEEPARRTIDAGGLALMPGMSARPPASMVCRAGSSVSPTATMASPRMPTAPVKDFAPPPSQMRAPRMRRSSMRRC